MEISQTLVTSALLMLLIVLSVAGVQLILVLSEIRQTLKRVNRLAEGTEQKIASLVQPLQQLSSAAVGLQAGFKAIEAVVEWIKERGTGELPAKPKRKKS